MMKTKRIPAILLSAGLWFVLSTTDGTAQGRPERVTISKVPSKVHRYVERILRQRDLDGNGQLEPNEWQQMSGIPSQIDLNTDTVLSPEELLQHVSRYGFARMSVHSIALSEEPGARPTPSEETEVSPTQDLPVEGQDTSVDSVEPTDAVPSDETGS